jgi:hypothetical protein
MQSKPEFSGHEPVDTSVRYDVYCSDHHQKSVLYRNVLFKSVKTLYQRGEHDAFAEYVELEHRDGQSVFVAKLSIARFCRAGTIPGGSAEG